MQVNAKKLSTTTTSHKSSPSFKVNFSLVRLLDQPNLSNISQVRLLDKTNSSNNGDLHDS